ncbi:hypothetical protein GF380_03675 [Candidatus Uhrbacteria bacterium]|nr:hypothetical protein [Candidatus Uhrbacteria bacterium]
MVKHLSNSSISKYQMCPRSWRFRYVDEISAPASYHLVFGIAFHNVIEAYVASGGSLQSHWQKAWSRAMARQHDVDWGIKGADDIYALGERMCASKSIQNTVAGLADGGTPLIEQYIEFIIPGVGVPFVGYVDMILPDGTVIDFKTSSRAWKPGSGDDSLQAAFYIAGLRANGYEVKDEFKFYVFTKSKLEGMVIPTTVDERRIAFALDTARSVWRGIKAEAFPPASSYGWWCSPKHCEYWDVCRK